MATGSGKAVTDGPLAQVDVSKILPADALTQPPKTSFDFTVTLRLQVTTKVSGFGNVTGEDRRTIALHRDQQPDTGLLPGFPIDMGGSGRASVTLYDLDGDPDGRLEIIAATTGDGLVALKYDNDSGQYKMMDGFPIDIREYDGLGGTTDVTLSHPAVADLFGDGEPQIVVTTFSGAVLAFFRNGKAHLDGSGKPSPLLPGFPVYAKKPDNTDQKTFGHGRSFLGSPVLADLDGDGVKEIVAASYDGNMYAWKPGPGKASLMPGFPVFCKSDPGLVPKDSVCTRDNSSYAPEIITTPAVGVLLPDSSNSDIAKHPSIVVGTSEVCLDYLNGNLKGTRLYAIYHNGNANASGSPFLPGFPMKLFGPISDALPLPPVGDGITSSPALARYNGKTYIGVGSGIWFPQLIEMDGAKAKVHTLISAAGFNALAQGAFASLAPGKLHFILLVSSILSVIDNWISLLKPLLVAWSVDDYKHPVISHEQHDSNWYSNPVAGDISGDGLPEAILGNGGFTVEAVDVKGDVPPTWPKFTNQWAASAPTLGDPEGDGSLKVFLYTLEGNLYGWRTLGATCNEKGAASDWWAFQHDERNTGFYGTDTQPPSVVTDLKVEGQGDSYTLTFTSPGDDWKCGKPASYDIRYASTAAGLKGAAAFKTALSVPATAIPEPVQGGEKVTFTTTLNGPGLWFAVQTIDHAGNHSLVSPPVSVNGPADDDNDTADDDEASPQPGGHSHSAAKGGCGC